MPALQVPQVPAWRRYVIEHDSEVLASTKASSLGILRKREVNGFFRKVEKGKSEILFAGEQSQVDLVERGLRNMAGRTNSSLKIVSRASFVVPSGVRPS